MAIAVTITNVDSTQNENIVEGVLTLTGNYGGASSHGDVFSLQGDFNKSGSLPIQVDIYEVAPAGAAGSGNNYFYMQGTTQANGALQVWTPAGAEYTEALAYGVPPFGIVGFALKFRAHFLSL